MGEKTNLQETLYMMLATGKIISFSQANISDFPDLEHDDNSLFLNVPRGLTKSFDPISLVLTAKFSRMSKKRYRKLLMAAGVSRNNARILCENVGRLNGLIDYSYAYHCFVLARLTNLKRF